MLYKNYEVVICYNLDIRNMYHHHKHIIFLPKKIRKMLFVNLCIPKNWEFSFRVQFDLFLYVFFCTKINLVLVC